MVNRWEEESSLSRLRCVLDAAETDRTPSGEERPGWERDLYEVTRRLERLRSEFPALAEQVELNVDLVKAGELLARGIHSHAGQSLSDDSIPGSREQ